MINEVLQELQEQTSIVQSDASQNIPCPGTGQIPQAMAYCEVDLHSSAIKSDALQASGNVASCEVATTKEVLSEDQQKMKVQSAASQTPSVHCVGKMPEDIVTNEFQPHCDAIRTDASQSHVPLPSSGSMALVTECLVEKSEGVEKTETNSKDGSNMEAPIGALELTSSGDLNKSGDTEGQDSSSLNGVLPSSSALVPHPSVKKEVYLGSEGSEKVGLNLGSTQCLSESVSAKSDVEQLQTEDLSLSKSFVSKAEATSIEHLAGGALGKEQETGDTMEETVVSPAVGTDSRCMKGITSFASPSTEAEGLVDAPIYGSYKPIKDKLEVAAEGTHSDKGAVAEVCEQDKLSVNTLETTKDLSRVEKEIYSIPETFEKQVNVADSLTAKCGSNLAAHSPAMKDSDVSGVAPSPRNESQSCFTVGTSQSEPERQAIAEANLDPSISSKDYSLSTLDSGSDKEFEKQKQIYSASPEVCESDMASVNFVETSPSTESGAQKESLSPPRLAANAEAVTETSASHNDTIDVAELQGNFSFDVKNDFSTSEVNVFQLFPADGSSENHGELKQVVVEDMRNEICEESASDEVDEIVPRQTENSGGQCRDNLPFEIHESKRSDHNVDVLNGDLNKHLSSTIAGTSKKVADLELVAEDNTGRINDGSVDSGQVAEKSEDMAIRDLTVEEQESKGADAAGDTSTSKNEVESQSPVIENIEKMYNKSVEPGEVTAAELLIERSEHLHVLDHAIEVQGNKGCDATTYASKSSSELNEAQPGRTYQIGTEIQLLAEEDSETMNTENTLPDGTAVKPQPPISENLCIQDPALQGPKNQQSDATQEFSTSNIEVDESQPKAADGTCEIAVESHLISKQNMEIHVEVATGNVTAENAAVGKSENSLSTNVAAEEKGKKESDPTDEISDSELGEPKTSPSTIEVKTHLICEEPGMTDKAVAPVEIETPLRELPGCSGRDLAVEGQEKEKVAASKNVSTPENEELKCSPGASAAVNGAESQLVAERDFETVLTKEVFSGIGRPNSGSSTLILFHVQINRFSSCFRQRELQYQAYWR